MASAGILISAVSLTIRIAVIVATIAGLNAYLNGLKDSGTHKYCDGVGCDSYRDHFGPNDDPDDDDQDHEDADPNDEDTDAETNETYYFLYDWQQALPASSLISVQ